MKRQEFSRRTKLQAWDRSDGRCEVPWCNAKLQTGRIEYDHRIPNELGGDNSLENCVVLCKPCHAAKTHKHDAPAIAKSRAVRASHVGARTVKRLIPGSKGSGLRKKLDGTVWRET